MHSYKVVYAVNSQIGIQLGAGSRGPRLYMGVIESKPVEKGFLKFNY